MAGESARQVAERRREKANRLNKLADAFERGAAGEEQTAAVLAGLPSSEWRVLHDLQWPGRRFANIDHVAVGPGGVFVIDSKAWQGRIEVRDDVLRQNGRSRESAVAGAADSAIAIADLVRGLSPGFVTPVLCFVGGGIAIGNARDVMVCSSANLLELLVSRPRVLNQDQVRSAYAALQLRLPSAATRSNSGGTSPRRRTPQPRVPTRRPRQRRSARAVPALMGLILLVIGLYGLGHHDFAGESQWLVHRIAPPAAASTTGRKLGTPVRIAAGTNRPRLRVTAERFVTTHATATATAPYLLPGNRFVAVRLLIRNLGSHPWRSQPGTTAQIVDTLGVPARAEPAFGIAAGRTLPAQIRLRPGHRIQGYVVFQIGVDQPVTGFTLTLGPGDPASSSWAVDRQ